MRIADGKTYDVLVAGAGSAGFCAALQAARLGCRVALSDPYTMPGGTLTVLGNNSIDEFNNPHRPKGQRRVIGGIAWEFVKELEARGCARIPDLDADFPKNYQYGVKVDPIGAAACMDEMLADAGVDLYYGQGIVGVDTEPCEDGEQVTGVILTTKSGPLRLKARIFIDCTGDGDLCAWAGAPFECGDDLQPGTLRLYIDSRGADGAQLAEADRILRKMGDEGKIRPEHLFGGTFRTLTMLNGDNTNHVSGLNSADSVSRMQAEIRARKNAAELIRILHECGDPIRIVGCAPACGPRESRRILGDRVMTGAEYLANTRYEDAVSYTYWYVDVHRNDGAPTKHIYLSGEDSPTISLAALRPRDLSNVYMAGRCVSADRECASAIRVKASCMAMGQAAGAAAAVNVRSGSSRTRTAGADEVRALLSEQGAIVPR